MINKGDVFVTFSPIYDLPQASVGVCVDVHSGANLVTKIDFLMEDGKVVTLTIREMNLFLKKVGTLKVAENTTEELIYQLRQFKQKPTT